MYDDNFYGSADTMQDIKSFVREWSMVILAIAIIAVVYIAYLMFYKKENYSPGATGWLTMVNYKENLVDPSTLDCASVSMAGFDSDDPYNGWAKSSLNENFSDRQLSTKLFN